jgi:hypothetical protein
VNIIVPHTRVMPEVLAAVPGARWEDVSADDEAYWRLLDGLWAAREPFVIVEHDIVPDVAALDSVWACSEPWCACGYKFENFGLIYGLGCTKFGAGAMALVPDALERVAQMDPTPEHPPRHWCSLDSRLAAVLGRAGLRQHKHGPVTHLRPMRSHAQCR